MFRYQEPIRTRAHIHSLKGKLEDVQILGEIPDKNQTIYIAEYQGNQYTTIFNIITGSYYVDDVYGKVDPVSS